MMTKLLAPIDLQAKALAFARDMILRLHSGDSSFEAPASRAFVRDFMRLGLATAIGRMHMVDLALAGEEDGAAILREVIVEMQSRHVELPTEFQDYANRVLAGMVPTSSWPAQKRKDQILRNIAIAMVVAAVVDQFGLKATGHSPRRRSACAVVAQALGEIRMARDYESVATIWKLYGRHLHLPLGWVAAMGPLP
jgi:hypothetical protein